MKIRRMTLGKLLILSFFFFTQEKSSRSGTDVRLRAGRPAEGHSGGQL